MKPGVPASAPRGAWAIWHRQRRRQPPRWTWVERRGCGSRVWSWGQSWRRHRPPSEGWLLGRNQSCWTSWRQPHCGIDERRVSAGVRVEHSHDGNFNKRKIKLCVFHILWVVLEILRFGQFIVLCSSVLPCQYQLLARNYNLNKRVEKIK